MILRRSRSYVVKTLLSPRDSLACAAPLHECRADGDWFATALNYAVWQSNPGILGG
jgi:hypothetical protein